MKANLKEREAAISPFSIYSPPDNGEVKTNFLILKTRILHYIHTTLADNAHIMPHHRKNSIFSSSGSTY